MNYVRECAAALAVLTSVGLAAAQNMPQTSPSGSPPSARSQQDTARPGASLQLSAQQKTAIYQSLGKEKVKSPPPASMPLTVGAQVPASVELYPLPANVLSQVPSARPYKYTVAQNQVVIVDPTDMKIVDIIKQ